jgi:hypothetical protein
MSVGDGKSLRAEWQRQWRATSGKIAVTIYLTGLEVELLDWQAWQLMGEDPRPEAVGRPAALRSLLNKLVTDHSDAISEWAQRAPPSPEERASFFRRELGQRRRGTQREKYEHLPRAEQQRIKQQAKARLREEERRWGEKAGAMPLRIPIDEGSTTSKNKA